MPGIFHELFRTLFPRKMRSIDDFIEVLKREGCEDITVYTRVMPRNWIDCIDCVGPLNWKRVDEFVAIANSGRRIVYREVLPNDIPMQSASLGENFLSHLLVTEEESNAAKKKLQDIMERIGLEGGLTAL